MATHVLDWGDSMKPRRRGGKGHTVVMMFAAELYWLLMLMELSVLFLGVGVFCSRPKGFCYHPNPNTVLIDRYKEVYGGIKADIFPDPRSLPWEMSKQKIGAALKNIPPQNQKNS